MINEKSDLKCIVEFCVYQTNQCVCVKSVVNVLMFIDCFVESGFVLSNKQVISYELNVLNNFHSTWYNRKR